MSTYYITMVTYSNVRVYVPSLASGYVLVYGYIVYRIIYVFAYQPLAYINKLQKEIKVF